MLPLIFMGVEMLLFDNSVLKMYLLNTQLNFHIKSVNSFSDAHLLHKTICRKYMTQRLIHDSFHIIPAIIPRPIYARYYFMIILYYLIIMRN